MTSRASVAVGLLLLACGGESRRHGARGSAEGSDSPQGGSGGTTSDIPLPDFDPVPQVGVAVTYLTDPAHTSAQTGSYLLPPWTLEYSTAFGGGVSYPLIVGERFFFTANGEVNHVANVHAKYLEDPSDDIWSVTPFEIGPEATSGHLAYDRGLVIVADESGHVAALDAMTGDERWSTTLATTDHVSAPVAVGGAVFVTGETDEGVHLFALRETDGSIAYRVPAQEGIPTYGGGIVYTSSDCYETRAVVAKTGRELWHYEGTCSGRGPSPVSSYWNGYLLTLSANGQVGVLDGATGTLVAELAAPQRMWPLSFGERAFSAEAYYTSPSSTAPGLFAYDVASLASPTLLAPLAGWPHMPMVVAPEYLVAWLGLEDGESTTLTTLRPEDGASVLGPSSPDYVGAPEADTAGGPLPGMAAGSERYLVLGWGRNVMVFVSQAIR